MSKRAARCVAEERKKTETRERATKWELRGVHPPTDGHWLTRTRAIGGQSVQPVSTGRRGKRAEVEY